jgi:hypothetical protein
MITSICCSRVKGKIQILARCEAAREEIGGARRFTCLSASGKVRQGLLDVRKARCEAAREEIGRQGAKPPEKK